MKNFEELYCLELYLILNNASTNNTFLVGGCVRDMLLSRIPKDYDIVTEQPISNLEEILVENGWSVSSVGKNFLVLFCSKNGYNFEVANFRSEFNHDGRHCQVEKGSIQQDAHRRDFTVNSLYLNPLTGEIIDPTKKGLIDLERKILRFIDNPEDRIKEDYLRIFRFYRLLKELNFSPDKNSLTTCRKFFKTAVDILPAERIRTEIEKLCMKGDL